MKKKFQITTFYIILMELMIIAINVLVINYTTAISNGGTLVLLHLIDCIAVMLVWHWFNERAYYKAAIKEGAK